MLLDRGAMITIPHDIKCGCEDCVDAQKDDSLRFSLARINSYKALSSSSMIALSSRDPIVTGRKIVLSQSLVQRAKILLRIWILQFSTPAFDLSNELKRLSVLEAQFRDEYLELRSKIQEFVSELVDHARTRYCHYYYLNLHLHCQKITFPSNNSGTAW